LAELPPAAVIPRGTVPADPVNGQTVSVIAEVFAPTSVVSLVLHYSTNREDETVVTMYDDGAHNDSVAGDSIYGGNVPSMPNATYVWYYFKLNLADGTITEFPPEKEAEVLSPGMTVRLSYGGLYTDVVPKSEWQVVTNTGVATSSRLYIYLNGEAEIFIDDVSITHGGTEYIQNGDFTSNDSGWSKTGNHSGTLHEPAIGYSSPGCERIVATAAGAEKPLGPYTDKSLSKPFDKDIDPFLFVDNDGKLYFYTVKFDRGNIIFGQEMESPEKLKGKSVRLLDPRPVCWETLNGNILEGPEVVCYRDKYYMIYAANHTSTRYGNYLMGCAAADSPLGFNETSKYPYPVMEQSDERITDSAKTLIAWGANGGPEWHFTTKQPEKNWISPDFSESKSWQKGTGGFGWPVYKKSRNHNVQTPWISSDIWMRLEFELSELPSKNLQLKVRHLDSVEIYFNGIQVHTNDRWAGPKLVELSKKDINALRVGKNIIAVHCNGTRKEKYLDIGLIDSGDKLKDDLIWNTGQPNLLRGLNGFEWYMIYFAMWNEGPHCQGINRTFFFAHHVRFVHEIHLS